MLALPLFLLFTVASATSTSHITKVHVVQSCHLDVGFKNSSVNIVNEYFDRYFPAAIATAQALRANNSSPAPNAHPGLVWMTQSYLVSLYLHCPPNMGLHCPNASSIASFKAAFQRGDLWFHAYPFNGEPEMADAHMFSEAVALSTRLAHELGVPVPTSMSQRDVPGMTRSVIPLLVDAGVEAISIGINTGSLPPAPADGARVMVWKDPPSGKQVFLMLHPHGYGGYDLKDCVVLDNFEEAMCPAWTGDNSGPRDAVNVKAVFYQIAQEFPNAQIVPSTLDKYAAALKAAGDLSLPVVDEEMGDTWSYGVPSDPVKVAQMRAMMRAFRTCTGECSADERVANFSRLMIKNNEHTWGKDVKTWLHDTTNWSNDAFQRQLANASATNFQAMIDSWVEQRDWGIKYPMQALDRDASHPTPAELQQRIQAEFGQLSAPKQPPVPSELGYKQIPKSSIASTTFDLGRLQLAFDPDTGAIVELQDKNTSIQWANPDGGFGTFLYQTLTQTDYDKFFAQYAQRINGVIPVYFPLDFGKPGMQSHANPNHTENTAALNSLWYKPIGGFHFFLLEFTLPTFLHTSYGAPDVIWAGLSAVDGGAALNMTFLTFDKTATRLVEAAWINFSHNKALGPQMALDKLAEPVLPLHVMTNGSRHLHGVWNVELSTPEKHKLLIEPVDTSLVCVGPATPFPTPRTEPDVTEGFAASLWNNIWGTNYVMWHPYLPEEANLQFRFKIQVS